MNRRLQFFAEDVSTCLHANKLLVTCHMTKEHEDNFAREVIYLFEDETLYKIHDEITKYLEHKAKRYDV